MSRSDRFSRLKIRLKQNGLCILLPILILLLSFVSYKILILPTENGLPALSKCTRFILPPIAILSACFAIFRLYCSALSLFSGYHVGIVFAYIGSLDATPFFLTVSLSLLCSLLIGVWLEILPILFSKWKKEIESDP